MVVRVEPLSKLNELPDASHPLRRGVPEPVEKLRTQLRQADWTGTDYDLGLATCRAEGKELRLELAALGLLPYEEG